MDRKLAPCLDCGADVPVEATTCPNCGYDVTTHDRPRLLLGGLGTALSASLVLAPVGLPLLWLARRQRLAAEGSVTRRAASTPADDLVRVIRRHLRLTPRAGRPSESSGGTGATRDALDVTHGPR